MPLFRPPKSLERIFAAGDEMGQHMLAAIVESSDDAIISKDLNGIITSWNAAATRMFGYSAEEAIGKSILLIVPPDRKPEEDSILARLRAGQPIQHYETQRVRKDGEWIDVSLSISPIRDNQGRVIGASKIARDITATKRAQQALRTTERLATVGRLAATIAHEINNPLESVVNLVYLAQAQAEQPDKVREYLGTAQQELQRISHLTKQTLGFYREQRNASPTVIDETVRQLISVLSPKTTNKGIDITLEVLAHRPITVNQGELRQVIANLLSNSIDAVPQGGVIRVRIAEHSRGDRSARAMRITIADNGPGIPQTERKRIFEPFFTTKKDVGTGLGLWVCKEIVERHKGDIRIHSSALPGRSGTCVTVSLPLSGAEVVPIDAGARPQAASSTTSGRRPRRSLRG